MKTGLLRNITALDMTVNVPGPFCSSILSDLGARVIKVEPPTGDPLRKSPDMWPGLNRGKRSIALDLKKAEGRQVLSRLASHSDVVLEGWRPGVAVRLGADFATLSASNPRIVYCSISGFGQEGPWRDRPAHDVNFSALAGHMAAQMEISGRPWPPNLLASDIASGLYAAVAILASLAGRRDGQGGSYIDLSVAESALALLSPDFGRVTTDGTGGKPNVTFVPHYGVFECADGRWFSVGIVDEDHFWRAFCTAAGLEDFSELTFASRVERGDALSDEIRRVFLGKTSDQWSQLFTEANIPGAVVADTRELLASPQFRHREAFTQVGGRTYVAQPFKSCGNWIGPNLGPPELGEHAAEILREIGYDEFVVSDLLACDALQPVGAPM